MSIPTETTTKRPSLLLSIGILALLFGLPVVLWFWGIVERIHNPVQSNCTRTTKQVQTIKKVDGGVDSVETEMVDGCEYPDGTFVEAPLPD